MAIAQSHARCTEAFASLQHAVQISSLDGGQGLVDIADEFDKYRLWAGNVGAGNEGYKYELSLDYRLRAASFYRDQVLKVLDILLRHARKAVQLLEDGKSLFEDLSSESEGETNIYLPPGAKSSVLMEEDSPWEISSDSEDGLSPDPLSHHHTVKAIPKKSSKIGTSSKAQDGLQKVLESIQRTVTALYRLPIRRPAPMDRLRSQNTDATSCYQHFDVMYVSDKFRNLDEQATMRLGKMITRRRQLLMYRKSHQNSLETKTLPAQERSNLVPSGDPSALGKQVQTTAPKIILESPSLVESEQTTLRTKATTLRTGRLPNELAENLFALSVAESEMQSRTSVAASEPTRNIRVEVPPRPRDRHGHGMTRFQCNYCQLTPLIHSNHAWK